MALQWDQKISRSDRFFCHTIDTLKLFCCYCCPASYILKSVQEGLQRTISFLINFLLFSMTYWPEYTNTFVHSFLFNSLIPIPYLNRGFSIPSVKPALRLDPYRKYICHRHRDRAYTWDFIFFLSICHAFMLNTSYHIISYHIASWHISAANDVMII